MAHGQHDAPLAGVTQCVGQEVLQHAPQQAAVAAHPGRAREQIHAQAAPGGDGRVLRRQLAHQQADIEIADHRVQAAGVQAGDIQQAIQQLLGRAQRGIHALGQVPLLFVVVVALTQRRGEQARGIERLQHIVADRRQEARLGLLRHLGLVRALGHALLQRLVGFQQRALGVFVVGDVVVAGDIATAGQCLAAHLDHFAVAAGALEDVRRTGAHVADAAVDLHLDVALAQLATLGVVADQVGHRAADVEHPVGVPEHLLVTAVPGGQAHVRVDHADPGTDVLQRGGKNLAVEAQLLPGFVEHRHHFPQVHARAAQQAGQQQARGGGADRGRQQALGELHPRPVRRCGGLQLTIHRLRLLEEGPARMAVTDHP